MGRTFNILKEINDVLYLSDIDDKELQAYENTVLKQSEKELLLMMEISCDPTYHCIKCGTEVHPGFPSPNAYCTECKKSTQWKKNPHWEDNIVFEDLIKLTFNKAHDIINKMSLRKRIKMLDSLDKHLLHCYDMTKEYNDQGFGKSMSPNIFYSIMGKIKHLEILQNWLYGIE